MRGYFDVWMLWRFLRIFEDFLGFMSVKIKDCLEESWTCPFEELHEREVYLTKWYPSFDVIFLIVDPWLEVLNKCFHF
jgi:hypothetical protein